MLSQITFTSHVRDSVTFEAYREIGVRNDAICKSLGFTGRLFVVESEQLNIIEGPSDINEKYYSAFVNDPRAKVTIRHFSRDIARRDFQDYGVWVNHSLMNKNLPAELHSLTKDTLDTAMTPHLPLRLRLIIDSYIRPKL